MYSCEIKCLEVWDDAVVEFRLKKKKKGQKSDFGQNIFFTL